jgi:TP901 family phage tail tape measure protein
MAGYTSTLTMRLIDGVSGPAKTVRGALHGVDAAAKRTATGRGGAIPFLAGGGKMFLTGAGVYAVTRGVTHAIAEYAGLERTMTRIGITAGATAAQVDAATARMRGLAQETAMPFEQTTAALATLVALGNTLEHAMALLPAILMTAQASGAASEDIAVTASKVGDAFEISADKMQNAFDIMVTGGKLGQFELRDMAKEIPSLAAAMAKIGYRGTDGLAKLVAMLQVAMKQAGSTTEAATNIDNVLQKLESEPVVTKFKKFGIDLHKEMDKARKEHKDLIDVYLDLVDRVTKGDLSKLSRLFTDLQMNKGITALMMMRDELNRMFADLHDVDGSTMRDFNTVLGDGQSSIDRFKNAWERLQSTLGRTGEAAGALKMLEDVAGGLDSLTAAMERFGSLKGALYETLNKTPETEAYSEAYEKLAGQPPPLGNLKPFMGLPHGLPWWATGKSAEERAADAIAQAKEDAYKAINEEEMGRRRRGPWAAHPGPQRPTTSVEGFWGENAPDFTLGAPGGFSTWIPDAAVNQLNRSDLQRLPPMPSVQGGAVPDWQFRPGLPPPPAVVAPAPAAPHGTPAPGVPMPRLRPPHVGQDFSAAGSEAGQAFDAALMAQLADTRRKVQAAVHGLRADLSFTASPRVNAVVSSGTVDATSREQGKTVDAKLHAAHYDPSYA